MDDEVLLCIGNHKVMLTPEEAFRICEIVNGASRIGATWHGKAKNGRGGNLEVIQPPAIDSVIAYVVPFTGHLRMTLDTNQRIIDEDSK